MRRLIPLAGVVLMVAVLAAFALFPTFNRPTSRSTTSTATPLVPDSTRSFFEKQVNITTGVAYIGFSLPNNPPTYDWITTLQSTGPTPIVSIQAELNISNTAPPVKEAEFTSNFPYAVGPYNPLYDYSSPAIMESVHLNPAQGSFYLGQTFPETVSVTFQNGTSVEFLVSATVFDSSPSAS